MVEFTKQEIEFIQKQDVCRVSTVSEKGWPQTTAVIHVFDGKAIYFATEFEGKKIENIKHNNKVSVLIDVYADQPSSVSVQGYAEILEKGKEFQYGLDLLIKRHEYYKENPFKEGESPIVRVTPVRKVSSF